MNTFESIVFRKRDTLELDKGGGTESEICVMDSGSFVNHTNVTSFFSSFFHVFFGCQEPNTLITQVSMSCLAIWLLYYDTLLVTTSLCVMSSTYSRSFLPYTSSLDFPTLHFKTALITTWIKRPLNLVSECGLCFMLKTTCLVRPFQGLVSGREIEGPLYTNVALFPFFPP